MDSFDAALLGIVQGLTEFLPVSSSGHLVMVQSLLGDDLDGGIVFEVAVHVATLVAIVLFYRRRIGELVTGTLGAERRAWQYVGKLALGTLPAVVVALAARRFIEDTFSTPAVAAALLMVTGGIVWSTRYTSDRGALEQPTWSGAFLIGCAQAVAILPGITRSGTTVAAALALGMAPLAAAEFSFLLGVIAITGAAVLMAPDLIGAPRDVWSNIVVGGIAALASGLAALYAFVWLLRSRRFYVFAWYAWAAGAAFLLWLAVND